VLERILKWCLGYCANRITLIGTEKGLGVNVAGEIKAIEDMTLDSQGNISNSGTIGAKTLTVSSKGINNTGNILGNNISLDADYLDNTTQTANIQATDSVSINLNNGLTNRDGAKILSKDGLISIDSGSVSNRSSVAGNRIVVNANSLMLVSRTRMIKALNLLAS
jgi:filamentous hemagglutinin